VSPSAAVSPGAAVSRSVEVVHAGPLTTVQDAGRAGLAHLAVPRSGALDLPSYRLANRLVGNREGAAVLETTFGGITIRPRVRCHVAVTGAWAAVAVDGQASPWGLPVQVEPGQQLVIGDATRGLRCYIAFSGGIAVTPVLGSRATDLLSGLGPPPLRDADVLPLGAPAGPPAAIDYTPYPPPPEQLTLRLCPGPRSDWLTADSLATLTRDQYTVATTSNRIALRLTGTELRLAVHTELPSEGIVRGAVQAPPDGQPLIFLADHPTTGGYPVVGVVHPSDLPQCAQARPGTPVRLAVRARRDLE
jgi:biotin-dependent carboxylase-like uncharacterized protein